MSETEATKRICPYCGEEKESRGLYAHVMNSDDNLHGEKGDVPEEFEPRKASIAGNDETITAPISETDVEEAPNKLMICHYCGDILKNKRGLSIHLAKSAGDEFHPEGISVADGEYTAIPADENWKPMIDASEMAQLKTQIQNGDTESDISDVEHVPSDEELEDRINELVIPQEDTKVDQVVSVLTQMPELYERPEKIRDILNCSRTTVYNGRNKFDQEDDDLTVMDTENGVRQEGEDSIPTEQIIREATVDVEGEPMVPLSEIVPLIRRVKDAEKIGNKLLEEYQ